MLGHREITCFKGKIVIYGARLLLVSRQVEVHLWHEGPAGRLSGIRTHNLLTRMCLEM